MYTLHKCQSHLKWNITVTPVSYMINVQTLIAIKKGSEFITVILQTMSVYITSALPLQKHLLHVV